MTQRENWGSSLGYIMAAAGSAVGLGNIWKFPYITGMNGGGAFVLVYLCSILLVGLPLMLCEMIIGRRSGQANFAAFRALDNPRSGLRRLVVLFALLSALLLFAAGRPVPAFLALLLGGGFYFWGFAMVGLGCLLAAVLILSYYAVVGGWIVEYVWQSFTMALPDSVAGARGDFLGYVGSPLKVLRGYLVFLLLTLLIVWGGIQKGIERWTKVLMPLLFLLLLAVMLRSLTLPGARAGVDFFLRPDFSRLTAAGFLEAIGHSFFTLSLAMGITITYGSYLRPLQNVFSAALWIVGLDTLAALMAGLAIFPAVFAMGLAPTSGPSLIFQTLPFAFRHFPGGMGWIWAGLFFLMLTVAAVTSAAALIENAISFFVDTFGFFRRPAVLLAGLLVGLLGLLSVFSTSDWARLQPVKAVLDRCFGSEHVKGSWFDVLDYVTSNWMLPLLGLLTVLFVGWVWKPREAARELRRGAESFCDRNLLLWLSGFHDEKLYHIGGNHGLTLMTLWGVLIRFVVPVVMFVVFLKVIGVNIGI